MASIAASGASQCCCFFPISRAAVGAVAPLLSLHTQDPNTLQRQYLPTNTPTGPLKNANANTNTNANTTSSSSSTGWQAPFVNLFKLCGVETASAPAPAAPAAPAGQTAVQAGVVDAAATPTPVASAAATIPRPPQHMGHEKSGRVLERMDTDIGKRVLRITGTIPAGVCVLGGRVDDLIGHSCQDAH